MKFKYYTLLILTCILMQITSCSKAHAGWFNATPNKELDEHKQKIVQVEQQLDLQRKSTGGWEAAAACLALGCILLFVIGTALGAKARRHALQSARI